VTAEVTVERVEYLTELPSLYPIPETPTASVIDLQDPKFNITKNGTMYTVDALIKPKYVAEFEYGIQVHINLGCITTPGRVTRELGIPMSGFHSSRVQSPFFAVDLV
jgi:hypothetical protein